jgi:hypothetical protein
MSYWLLGLRAATGTLMLVASGTVAAHHSFAIFDHDHQVKLIGKITDFKWQNPHVYIELDVPDNDQGHTVWTIECANPGILNRVGWKFNMVKPGDEVTLIVAPLRTGESGALLKQITLADGRVFDNGAPAGKALIW